MGRAPCVALLESRMGRELSRLVEKHGGKALCFPAVHERHELSSERAHALIEELLTGQHDLAIFMTGVAASLLFEAAEKLGRRADLVNGLESITTVCRGPKPTAALRGFGVLPSLTANEPFTTAEVIDTLAGIDLRGCRVLLFHYGERSDSLAETLLARQAVVSEQWLYRWYLPEDASGLEQLVRSLIAGELDALAVTCQIQFRHLHQVAQRLGLAADLIEALNHKVTVAAVGPTCSAILRAHGVRVNVMPEHPKMGPLVISLMRSLVSSAHL
ncbi:MAG: uroporphyrinogen-III synthase [Myxococcales bacterium]